MVSKQDKQKALDAWAEAVQEGANEFLELALEMKEAGKEGYEWPYMLGLFVDQLAKHIRTGSCAPDMTKAQKTHLAVALSAVADGYNTHRVAADVPLFDHAEEMYLELKSLMRLCPVQLPVIKKQKEQPKKEQLELPTWADVIIVLPKGTPPEKVDRITCKVNDMFFEDGSGSFCVTVGETEATQVRVRAGDEQKYGDMIEEVLRGHIPVPEKTTPAEDPTPQS